MKSAVTSMWGRWSRPGWRTEILLFGLALLAYQGARAVTRGGTADALANADRVFDLERALGINVEGPLQRALLGTPWLTLLDWVYLLAQQAVLAAGIVYVYRRSRPVYRTLRTTLLATWVLTLPVYALFPTAPPRLTGLGLLDSVSDSTPVALGSGSTTFFYNPYAAVPSLHAGFAVALGIAVALSARSWALRAAGLVWGPLVILSILATGNHFVVDAAAGVVVTGLGFGIALLIGRAPIRIPAFGALRAAAPPAVGAMAVAARRALPGRAADPAFARAAAPAAASGVRHPTRAGPRA